MRKLNIDLTEILNLISCAEDYGFNDSVLMNSFAEMIETLSEEEIEEYCSYYLSEEGKKAGYSEEDYEAIKEKLEEFKKDYL